MAEMFLLVGGPRSAGDRRRRKPFKPRAWSGRGQSPSRRKRRLWLRRPPSVEMGISTPAARRIALRRARSWPAVRTRRGLIALRPRGIAHHGNNVGLRRRADIVLRPLAHLVAFIEQLDLLHLLEGLAQGRFGIFELDLQILRRVLEVVAPLDRRLCIGRIGEMARIMNAGAILLDLDVALEIAADALEFADHALDLGDPTTPLVDLKFLQANECLA